MPHLSIAESRLLLPAGIETTYRSSGNLLFLLLTAPEQLAAVRRDRSLLPQAIEEALRLEPPLTSVSRTGNGCVNASNATSTVTSSTATTSRAATIASSDGTTYPSTELSIATTPASTRPAATSS